MASGLRAEQIASYESNGYLCPITIMDGDEELSHCHAVEALERDFDGKLPRKVGEYLRIFSYLATDVPLRIAHDPSVLDKVESILGPDILMWSCEYLIKEANSRHIVSWH